MKNENYFLANEPLPIRDGLFLHYPNLRSMMINEDSYYEFLNVLLTQKENLGELFVESELSLLDSILFVAVQQKDFLEILISALLFFTKKLFFLDEESYFLYYKDEEGEIEFIMTDEDWTKLINSLAEFNFISIDKIKEKSKKPQYANEAARKIAERIEATRREVSKYKKERTEGPFDKVSEVCAKSQNINIMQVWDLNYYQYNCQFRDLLKIESYDMTSRAMLAGAKVTLTHWSEKTD